MVDHKVEYHISEIFSRNFIFRFFFEKNRNVLLSIREKKRSGNTIFVIIGKMTLKKRVREQKENKLRIFLWTLKVLNV